MFFFCKDIMDKYKKTINFKSDANDLSFKKKKKMPRFSIDKKFLFYKFYKNKIQEPAYNLYIDEILNNQLSTIYVLSNARGALNEKNKRNHSAGFEMGNFEGNSTFSKPFLKLSFLTTDMIDYLFPVVDNKISKDEMSLIIQDSECIDNFLKSLEVIMINYGFIVYVPRIKYVYSTKIPAYLNPSSLPLNHKTVLKAVFIPDNTRHARMQLIFSDLERHLRILTKVLKSMLEFKFGMYLAKLFVDIFQKYLFGPIIENTPLHKTIQDPVDFSKIKEKLIVYQMMWTDLLNITPMYKRLWGIFTNFNKLIPKKDSAVIFIKNNKIKIALHLFSVIYLTSLLNRSYSLSEYGTSFILKVSDLMNEFNGTILDWGIAHFPVELTSEIMDTVKQLSSFSLDSLIYAGDYLMDEYFIQTHNPLNSYDVQTVKKIKEKREKPANIKDKPANIKDKKEIVTSLVAIQKQLKAPVQILLLSNQEFTPKNEKMNEANVTNAVNEANVANVANAANAQNTINNQQPSNENNTILPLDDAETEIPQETGAYQLISDARYNTTTSTPPGLRKLLSNKPQHEAYVQFQNPEIVPAPVVRLIE